jgi:Ser-tRNA(Ala) deacylase AlaX
MTTLKRFWQDPYQTHLETRVAHVDGDWVGLESTLFFAFSGGQESDTGRIGAFEVLEAAKRGLDVVYLLPAGHGLAPGDTVQQEIDWARRYRLMRLHFAAEMVLQLVYRQRPGIERIGAHIAADKSRIDFALADSIAPLLPAVAKEAARLIAADLPIRCDFSEPRAQRRYWEVEGFARMACGGTHPRRTGEVGAVVLKRKNIGKCKERIEITLG